MPPVLSGLRVIAVEQYGAGPYGSMQLADLGAEIIKIENPAEGGDMARRVGPFFFGDGDKSDDSQFFHSFNRNKKSVTLDLKKPRAREVLHRLAARSDALFDNLRGDLPAKLGLTYAHLAAANPQIVCAHLRAYGRDGSRAPDGPPSRMGLSIVDLMTGLFAAFALVSGVLAARQSGKGRDLDVSLFDAALQNLAYLATWYLNAGHVQGREPRSGHPSLVPSQLYRTADGFIFIMCNKEKFWPILCERVGRPEWADDSRFRSFKDRLANRDEVNRLLDGALSTRTTEEWLRHFAGRVPAAPVNDLKAALDNPFVAERGGIRDYGRARMVAGPVRDNASEPPPRAAPALGADTDAV